MSESICAFDKVQNVWTLLWHLDTRIDQVSITCFVAIRDCYWTSLHVQVKLETLTWSLKQWFFRYLDKINITGTLDISAFFGSNISKNLKVLSLKGNNITNVLTSDDLILAGLTKIMWVAPLHPTSGKLGFLDLAMCSLTVPLNINIRMFVVSRHQQGFVKIVGYMCLVILDAFVLLRRKLESGRFQVARSLEFENFLPEEECRSYYHDLALTSLLKRCSVVCRGTPIAIWVGLPKMIRKHALFTVVSPASTCRQVRITKRRVKYHLYLYHLEDSCIVMSTKSEYPSIIL